MALLGWALLGTGCPQSVPEGESKGGSARVERVLYLSGAPVADVVERWSPERRHLQRRTTLRGAGPEDQSIIEADLDPEGFVTGATYRRRGPRGNRDLSLRAGELHSEGRHRAIKAGKTTKHALLETLCFLEVRQDRELIWVDLATGETLAGFARHTEDEQGTLKSALDSNMQPIAACRLPRPPTTSAGSEEQATTAMAASLQRRGPGAFVELEKDSPAPPAMAAVTPPAPAELRFGQGIVLGGLGVPRGSLDIAGPGQKLDAELPPKTNFMRTQAPIWFDAKVKDRAPPTPALRKPDLFLESDDDAVRKFAHEKAGAVADRSPLTDALTLSKAIGELLDTSQGGGPPSARMALERKAGDCDDATALLVASLRARGHAARPVVGYRAFRGRWVPHAWAEVWTGDDWAPADAFVPGIGPFPTHLRLFEGLGSPLTLGRTLGALEIAVVAKTTSAKAGLAPTDAGPE